MHAREMQYKDWSSRLQAKEIKYKDVKQAREMKYKDCPSKSNKMKYKDCPSNSSKRDTTKLLVHCIQLPAKIAQLMQAREMQYNI